MATYLLRRLGFILLTMLLASIVIFAATQFLPGDVAQVMLGQFATPEAVANLREELGLNRAIYVQYLDWLGGFVSGDWGVSLASRQPVRPMVLARLRNSAMLAAAGAAVLCARWASCWACLPRSTARNSWTRPSRR